MKLGPFSFAIMALAFIAGATVVSAKEITSKVPELSGGCYQISTAEELYGFAEIVNGHDSTAANTSACGELTKDIVVNKNVLNKWDLLNSDSAETLAVWKPMVDFAGKFDGNGHTISGLYSPDSAGLFESITSPENSVVVVRDLGILDSYFSSTNYLGVLVNSVYGPGKTQITNFYTFSTIKSTKSNPYIAGVVGYVSGNASLTLTNCYSVANLVDNGNDYYSRLLGYTGSSNESIEVINSYAIKLSSSKNIDYGTLVDTAALFNGALTFLLRENAEGSIWGQDVGRDPYPIFTGTLKNSIAARYNVTFHTFDSDTARYLDNYVAGLITMLPKGTSKENLVFGGWYRDAEFSGENDTAISNTTTGDLEYWAKMYDRYKVTYHPNGGKMEEPGPYIGCGNPNKSYQDVLILTGDVSCYLGGIGSNLRDRYYRDSSMFLGWYDNEELEGDPVDSITTSDKGDKDFYAKWYEYKRPAIDPEDSCYIISNAAELYGFSALVDGSFTTGKYNEDERLANVCGKLTKDIVVNENVLMRDGTLDSSRINDFIPWKEIVLYNGFFDGQGHTISGLYMEDADGMFFTGQPYKYAETKVVIHNLKVRDSFISQNFSVSVGGIIGSHSNAYARIEIENTHFDGTIVVPGGYLNAHVGGLVAEAHNLLIIRNSSHRGLIDVGAGDGAAGGLVGLSDYYTFLIQNSNEGRFVGDEEKETQFPTRGYVGGLVGEVSTHFFIVNNYNAADFDCHDCYVNGLIGGYYVETDQRIHARAPVRPEQSFVLNNHSKGSIISGVPSKLDDWVVTFDNNFYLDGTLSRDSIGTPVEASAFEDGTVTKALHDYVQKDALGNEIAGSAYGANWIQGDEYPVLTGSETRNVAWLYVSKTQEPYGYVLFYTPGQEMPLPTPSLSDQTFLGWEYGDALVTEIPATASGNLVLSAQWKSIPSSSSVASSSSQISSSSEKSSSSEAASSSSGVNSSSSSAKPSSSSSSGAKSSSSKDNDALPVMNVAPQFTLSTVGREIQVVNARVGAAYAVLDLQGRIVKQGQIESANFAVMVERAGNYLVRIGSNLQMVQLK